MDKEGMINEIQKDLKGNRKIWDKNNKRGNIFLILAIISTIVLIIVFSFVSLYLDRSSVNIVFFLPIIALPVCFFLSVRYANKSDKCRKKERYLKKALWIVEYWLSDTPTLELDKSFLKYNYPTEENRSAVDYVLNHIDMEIKEKK